MSHSGFAVTTPDVILVFDYERDPSHALHRILEQNPDTPVVFFVSHRHQDHYNKSIFELAQNHKRVYVLSNDVPARDVPTTLAVQGMSAGDYVENLPGGISVKAYASTDEGVSFFVTTGEGETIFHAGDLNDWSWVNEPEDTNAWMRKNYRKEIAKLARKRLHAAFVVLDPRQEMEFAKGITWFLQHVEAAAVFPMHCWDDYSIISRYKNLPESAPYRNRICDITAPGQSFWIR